MNTTNILFGIALILALFLLMRLKKGNKEERTETNEEKQTKAINKLKETLVQKTTDAEAPHIIARLEKYQADYQERKTSSKYDLLGYILFSAQENKKRTRREAVIHECDTVIQLVQQLQDKKD